MMNKDELETALKASLDDLRVTRGERKAIRALIDDQQLSPHELSVCRSVAFELATQAIDAANTQHVLGWLEDINKLLHQPAQPIVSDLNEVWFSPGDRCVQRIRSLFAQTQKSVDVCVFTITDDRVAEAILEAKRRGILVRIITDNEKSYDAGSDAERLATEGIEVRVDQTPFHMHHKFAIFDGSILLNGSYNWTRSAAENNEENFIVTDHCRLVSEFQKAFDSLWVSLSHSAS